jgi:ABC-type transport system involved in cytochrome c biogenesis permease subunit
MKSKKKTLIGIGIAMLLFAIGFFLYALNNPQFSFPWSNTLTYSIYLIYIVVIIVCFVMARRT